MELNFVKLKELSETKEPLKYKELCEFLNIEIKTGEAKRTACGNL